MGFFGIRILSLVKWVGEVSLSLVSMVGGAVMGVTWKESTHKKAIGDLRSKERSLGIVTEGQGDLGESGALAERGAQEVTATSKEVEISTLKAEIEKLKAIIENNGIHK